jgi:hypothetical protein
VFSSQIAAERQSAHENREYGGYCEWRTADHLVYHADPQNLVGQTGNTGKKETYQDECEEKRMLMGLMVCVSHSGPSVQIEAPCGHATELIEVKPQG